MPSHARRPSSSASRRSCRLELEDAARYGAAASFTTKLDRSVGTLVHVQIVGNIRQDGARKLADAHTCDLSSEALRHQDGDVAQNQRARDDRMAGKVPGEGRIGGVERNLRAHA